MPALRILGAEQYWEDRCSVLLRLANALADPAQRAQLRMYAEQDHAIAQALRQEARRHQTGGSDDDAEPRAPEPSP